MCCLSDFFQSNFRSKKHLLCSDQERYRFSLLWSEQSELKFKLKYEYFLHTSWLWQCTWQSKCDDTVTQTSENEALPSFMISKVFVVAKSEKWGVDRKRTPFPEHHYPLTNNSPQLVSKDRELGIGTLGSRDMGLTHGCLEKPLVSSKATVLTVTSSANVLCFYFSASCFNIKSQ